jgi:hypothetical protein
MFTKIEVSVLQAVQVESPALEYVPSAQAVHCVAAAAAKKKKTRKRDREKEKRVKKREEK